MLFALGFTVPYLNVHLQPVYHGPLDVHKAAVSWPLLPRRWLLCHDIRCQTLPLPWHLHLHSSPGRGSPRAGGKGTVHPCLTYSPLQSPQLPSEGTLMAVYDKSGYSHSETSLVSIIYLSKKVRLHALSQACAVSHCLQVSIWLLLLLLPIPSPLSLQDKIVISEDEVITNSGDTKLLPYKTRKSFWDQHWELCVAISLEHGSWDSLLSPEILQTTSPSSDRHPPTSRCLPPSGWNLCSRCSLSSRCTSQSRPSSKARPEVSTVLLVTPRVTLAVSSPLQLDAEGTGGECLILALHIQGTCSSSHIRPVIINQRGTAGEGRALGYMENWMEGPGLSCSQIPPTQGSAAISTETQQMISQPAWVLMKALPHSLWTPGVRGTVQLPSSVRRTPAP